MAKEKEKKNYEFTTADGKFNFKVLNPKGVAAYSIGGPYPIYTHTADGTKKLTRKQAIEWCIKVATEAGRL